MFKKYLSKIVVQKRILAWCLYDWANSAFSTIVITFLFSAYFIQTVAPSIERGTILWSRTMALSGLLVAILAPIIGSISDETGIRKILFICLTVLGAFFTTTLALVSPEAKGAVYICLSLVLLANLFIELSIVLYNSYLPEIITKDAFGRVSGYGWGLGYIGGILGLVLCLYFIDSIGPHLDDKMGPYFKYRVINLLVGAWVLIFSMPLFLLAPQESKMSLNVSSFKRAFHRLMNGFLKLKGNSNMVTFLLAHLFYNDGLITVFTMGGVYAAGTFSMSLRDIMVFGITLNVIAGIGAFFFGHIDDKIGAKNTILISIGGLFLATLGAALAPSKWWLWFFSTFIGLFVGPNQSSSRSLMGRLIPPGNHAEFFGFYTLSGKMTSFIGPFLFGIATGIFHNPRAGVLSTLAFFLIGGMLLFRVKENA
ncbi:MFS transporter family protein [Dissulfuribacter thermophilus]|uniref:MFS transporter family protein n=1 Tax=Dissulfuribacter thermophilus TaxID=1156395 RepID=A0A1B9F9H8_9BACT|nr:MFS transporter [Dissulfuribacter thermophilus]OCC16562.1 MFS transporter family protein [Dissulfuribacter thermophilus]